MDLLARAPLLAVLIATASPVLAASNLPFVEDDYARALAEARSRKLPLFIEAWAPW